MTVVLLDLYDTIAFADWDAHAAALAARIGVPLDRLLAAYDETRTTRATGEHGNMAGDLAVLASACGVTLEPGLIATIAAERAQVLATGARLYEDTLPTLRRLRAAGRRLGVISNCDRATRVVVDTLGLEREVDTVVLSCEVGSRKPDAAIFETALRRLGARADEALFVDDQTSYLDGAAALGIRTYRIVRGAGGDRSGPHPVITSLTSIA